MKNIYFKGKNPDNGLDYINAVFDGHIVSKKLSETEKLIVEIECETKCKDYLYLEGVRGVAFSDEPICEEIVNLTEIPSLGEQILKEPSFLDSYLPKINILEHYPIKDRYYVSFGSQVVIRRLSENDKYYNTKTFKKEYYRLCVKHKLVDKIIDYKLHIKELKEEGKIDKINPKHIINESEWEQKVLDIVIKPIVSQNYLWLEDRLSQCFDIEPGKRFTTSNRPKVVAEGFKPKTNKIKLHFYNPTSKYKPVVSDIHKRTDCDRNGNLYFVGETDKGVYMKLLDEKESKTWNSGNEELFLSVMNIEIKGNNVNEKCWTVTDTEPEVFEMNYDGDIPDDIDRRIKGAPDYLIGFFKGKRLTLKLGKEVKLFVKEYFEVDESKHLPLFPRKSVHKDDLKRFFIEYIYSKYNIRKDNPDDDFRYYCSIVGDLPEVREEW